MQLFVNDKIENNNGQTTLVLYLNPNLTLVEFASEFGYSNSKKREKLNESALEYAKSKYPDLKLNAIKIMLGCMLVTSFPTLRPFSQSYAQNITSNNVNIVIDNKLQNFEQSPVLIDGIVYVPIRALAEHIGASVWFNSTSNTVGINKGDTRIAFVIGSSVARKNGVQVPMDRSMSINNHTMVSVRFLSEHLGFTAIWNEQTKTITINTSGKNHVVQPGDTLWRLSRAYNVSIDDLKRANNLTSDTIIVGQNLIIPSKSNVTNTTNSNFINTTNYTVQAGDTLWRLSQRYNTSVDTLKSLNNLTSDVLMVGQILKIPTQSTDNIPSEFYSYNIPSGYTVADLYWLSRIVHAESESEPYEGKLAVANVILNRVKSRDFPNDIKSVIFDTTNGVQFQPISNGTIYNNPNKESINAALDALRGINNIENALFFLNPSTATSPWITNNRPFYKKIANHDFYL
ncbi:Copper amine oxidase N-terminal domain-containing protein [Alkalithermobacter thermoalcaliphilus JW-YL-7 = DSM 7308]|uniref:Cell wall hydrolase SleB n=1 Tax=Alkalithermobacter thermoalcaliphilus JW-YL-7 = DSM 7308 TaxID=1121328 RepID=A0A150FS25_CLOPD|nr:cell wall hydrolase SleB [[Clostridium] paradoxum JW-YL-7 = DSM 7308]SHK34691.1 Copper amine oxidase N-terminal domain-containing protein [[Clostridium] paradoxum JW-YL-7 = DSM 7308]